MFGDGSDGRIIKVKEETEKGFLFFVWSLQSNFICFVDVLIQQQ